MCIFNFDEFMCKQGYSKSFPPPPRPEQFTSAALILIMSGSHAQLGQTEIGQVNLAVLMLQRNAADILV